MKILPYKRLKVADKLKVKVSNHFHYSDFGVRDSGEMRYNGRRYVASETPGTGFVERESESHSYHEFVRQQLAKQQPSYLRMVLGKEPDYAREIKRVNEALATCENAQKREMLECYLNALGVGLSEEKMQRVVRGIKDKMGHHSNKFYVSVLSHYKHKINQYEHDVASVEYDLKHHCSPETYEAYLAMVDAFKRVASCRRIWQYDGDSKEHYLQVFFDMGVFDFIRSESFIPLIRDTHGRSIYLLPDSVIVARSSVDFDLLPLKTLTIVSQELAIEEPVDVLSSRLGDAASMIRIPELGLSFYFNHVHAIVDFVEAVDKLKETL